ncbi:MAG: hypothetical protein Q7S28_03565 [bacterium]|nr:hypothetical protein [bacterium]
MIRAAIKIILWYPLYKKTRSSKTFTFQGDTYNYFIHYYNVTWENERSVEIPIARKIVNEYLGKKVLEIGNVLSNYFAFDHDILDKYERGPGLINEDVCDFQPDRKYDLIISVSTMEHVGWDEPVREPRKILKGVENLKTLLAPQGKLVITIPVGYNTDLDKLLNDGELKFTKMYCLKKLSKDNEWKEVGWDDISHAKYNYPYPGVNGSIIGIIENK